MSRRTRNAPSCLAPSASATITIRFRAVYWSGYLETQKECGLARLVKPRRPYRPKPLADDAHWHAICRFSQDLEELSAPIADLERDGKGVPILIKQYMKAGGRVLGFNVDPRFSNVLDVLMMADLRRAPQPMLERYMGRGRRAPAFLAR